MQFATAFAFTKVRPMFSAHKRRPFAASFYLLAEHDVTGTAKHPAHPRAPGGPGLGVRFLLVIGHPALFLIADCLAFWRLASACTETAGALKLQRRDYLFPSRH